MSVRAVVGLGGETLTDTEARMLSRFLPAGVILFGRNIRDPVQLARLIASIRALVPGVLLVVDQEGGRVARLRPPHWRAHPSAAAIGAAGPRAAWLHGALIGTEARAAGFDVVCAPVLDLRHPGASDVVGDRAFGSDPDHVGRCGAAMAAGLRDAGIRAVAKHVPGHGRARIDSHHGLPRVDGLAVADLAPFAANTDLWWMTAHVVYAGIDTGPATISRKILMDLVRGELGFAGVLLSDDLAMGALDGAPADRARAAWDAGCDLALYCPGDAATESVLAAAPPLDPALAARWTALAPHYLDMAALAAERDALVGASA